MMQSRGTWALAEDKLRDLVDNHGTWAEAKNRLATLLFMKGQVYDSSLLCEQVLQAKPFHFGCLSGAAMCYERLNNEERMVHHRRRQLPPMGTEERNRWVDFHVKHLNQRIQG